MKLTDKYNKNLLLAPAKVRLMSTSILRKQTIESVTRSGVEVQTSEVDQDRHYVTNTIATRLRNFRIISKSRKKECGGRPRAVQGLAPASSQFCREAISWQIVGKLVRQEIRFDFRGGFFAYFFGVYPEHSATVDLRGSRKKVTGFGQSPIIKIIFIMGTPWAFCESRPSGGVTPSGPVLSEAEVVEGERWGNTLYSLTPYNKQ